jgi:hypothetical protein
MAVLLVVALVVGSVATQVYAPIMCLVTFAICRFPLALSSAPVGENHWRVGCGSAELLVPLQTRFSVPPSVIVVSPLIAGRSETELHFRSQLSLSIAT